MDNEYSLAAKSVHLLERHHGNGGSVSLVCIHFQTEEDACPSKLVKRYSFPVQAPAGVLRSTPPRCGGCSVPCSSPTVQPETRDTMR